MDRRGCVRVYARVQPNLYIHAYTYIHTYQMLMMITFTTEKHLRHTRTAREQPTTAHRRRHSRPHHGHGEHSLTCTRYSFTSRLFGTNQPSFHSPRPPALPTLVQYYCTLIGQFKTLLPTSRLYTIHHTILVITILCSKAFAVT